jgi:thiamine biosynthesis protein ThiS
MGAIVANGKRLELHLPCALIDFLTQSGWKPTQVVVELNGDVIPRTKLTDVQLHDGDQLEVIVPVAGG